MKAESKSEQLVTRTRTRHPLTAYGQRLNQILSMRVVGLSPNISAAVAAKQGTLGCKLAHRCWSHMLNLIVGRIQHCLHLRLSMDGIKSEEVNLVLLNHSL